MGELLTVFLVLTAVKAALTMGLVYRYRDRKPKGGDPNDAGACDVDDSATQGAGLPAAGPEDTPPGSADAAAAAAAAAATAAEATPRAAKAARRVGIDIDGDVSAKHAGLGDDDVHKAVRVGHRFRAVGRAIGFWRPASRESHAVEGGRAA
jgi:pyruvate/2-oxoglutarate dehydrogenase complex dihydrolipoamide acyltransferase (E2) component